MESTAQQGGKSHTDRGGLIRRIHRLVAVLFTVSVIATTVALMQAEPVMWVSYVPLFPLALLFCTGAYMFVLPYTAGRRAARGR